MIDTTKTHEIIRVAINTEKPTLLIEIDWIILIAVAILILAYLLFRKRIIKLFHLYEMEFEISGSPKAKFKVRRNSQNLYIANRIYIELTTRKAAIPIDEENDVIEEVYNSWYKLFEIIREEIKSLPGEYLKDHDPTNALIGLTSRILNEGLRPHLTKYQARYRQWLKQEIEKRKDEDITPQEI
ncbi:unnamed protein product, partial [marine sediment metagenome]